MAKHHNHCLQTPNTAITKDITNYKCFQSKIKGILHFKLWRFEMVPPLTKYHIGRKT